MCIELGEARRGGGYQPSNLEPNSARFPERENLLNNIAVVYFCATRGDSLEAQLVRVGEGRDIADRDVRRLGLE